MRDKDIKFIHIISIATIVYSNGINIKIIMSHWRHLTITFKLSYIVLLDDIRIHERFSSSNLNQPASIRLCTVEAMTSKIILMMPKNQELSNFQTIKIQEQSSFKNQDSRTIKIKIHDSRFKNQEMTQ